MPRLPVTLPYPIVYRLCKIALPGIEFLRSVQHIRKIFLIILKFSLRSTLVLEIRSTRRLFVAHWHVFSLHTGGITHIQLRCKKHSNRARLCCSTVNTRCPPPKTWRLTNGWSNSPSAYTQGCVGSKTTREGKVG